MQKAIHSRKESEVQSLVERIQNAKAVIAFDYQGLTAEQFNALRKALREKGCECQIYKNNITRRAYKSLNYDSLVEHMTGPKALLFSNDDVVAPAKIIYDFAKENDKIKISVGVVEKQAVSTEKVLELATLPSYETLLTMLAAGMLSPVRDVTVGLHMLVEKLEEEAQA
jgi:large subunit ribosomal protein L10